MAGAMREDQEGRHPVQEGNEAESNAKQGSTHPERERETVEDGAGLGRCRVEVLRGAPRGDRGCLEMGIRSAATVTE